MGEGKRRKKEILEWKQRSKNWLASLTEDEEKIFNLACRLDQSYICSMQISGACYHMAFFMTKYLAHNGICVSPIIGWVSDGTWQGVTSHAWVEYNGKKTDVSLTYTDNVVHQPTGALLVHDHVVRLGMATYQYFYNDDPEAIDRNAWVENQPDVTDVYHHKMAQHKQMLNIAELKEIDKYLSSAPQGGRYEDICRIIE